MGIRELLLDFNEMVIRRLHRLSSGEGLSRIVGKVRIAEEFGRGVFQAARQRPLGASLAAFISPKENNTLTHKNRSHLGSRIFAVAAHAWPELCCCGSCGAVLLGVA